MPELVSPQWEVRQPAISGAALAGLNTLRGPFVVLPEHRTPHGGQLSSLGFLRLVRFALIMIDVHDRRKQRIVELLDLEDTGTQSICAFAIQRSKGPFPVTSGFPFQFPVPDRWD